MKKLLLLSMLLTTVAYSQKINVSVLGSVNAVQIETEKVWEHAYVKVAIEYSFNETYKNFHFGIGYSNEFGMMDDKRFYIGAKMGIIQHNDQFSFYANPAVGAETGLDFKVSEKISIGGRYGLDYREDLKFYGVNYKASLKGQVFFRVVFEL